jgi:hypothetical protein
MATSSFLAYSPYLTGASYGLEAFGQIAQGIAASRRAKRVSEYNARVIEEQSRAAAQAADIEALQYERQAQIAEQDALVLDQTSTYQQARLRDQHERVLAETRAIVAGSGLLLRGSPLRVYEETARQQERDVLALQYQTRLQQRALQMQGQEAQYAASLARYGAGERLRVGGQQAAATRGMREGGQVAAGLLRGIGTAAQGVEAGLYQKEWLNTLKELKLKETPASKYRYTRDTSAQKPFIWWG